MKKGDMVKTPRFLNVRINEVYPDRRTAMANGYIEPTHYFNGSWFVHGKRTGENRMVFAAYPVPGAD